MNLCMRLLRGLNRASNNEGGDNDGELGLLCLAGEGAEDDLRRSYAAEVHQRQRGGERTVDEGAVYKEVYIVEAVLEDGEAHGHGNPRVAQHEHVTLNLNPQRWRIVTDSKSLWCEEDLADQADQVHQTYQRSSEGYPTQRAASDQVNQEAAREYVPPTPRPCSFVPSVTTLLYRIIVFQALREAVFK